MCFVCSKQHQQSYLGSNCEKWNILNRREIESVANARKTVFLFNFGKEAVVKTLKKERERSAIPSSV